SGQTVFSYAADLMSANWVNGSPFNPINPGLAPTAVGLWSYMTGLTPTIADATSLATKFLTSQQANATKFGFKDFITYGTEAMGLALAGDKNFNKTYVSLDQATFASTLSSLLNVNQGAINDFIKNWTSFYTKNPDALKQGGGLTLQQAVYGA